MPIKSQDVQPGDFMPGYYTVEEVKEWRDPSNNELYVEATVRFFDGGQGLRLWEIDQDVPLRRDK